MKPARSLIPIGTATLLPDTARRVRKLEDQLLAHLASWGYREIILPTFEYLDVLSVGLAPEVLEKCYKFADWTTGRILVLRPDVTAQIARIVAMDMGGMELPLRLSYRTTVFRYEPEHAGREREVFQVGVELIGADDPHMDAEIITLLIESLKHIGLPDFKVSLGHVGFYKGLLERTGMSKPARKEAEFAAAHKDLPRLEQVMSRERVPRKYAHVILEAAGRYGQDDVLEWGRKAAGRNSTMRKPLERLANVYKILELTGVKDHILIDLGEFRGFDYYDGVVFDVFTATLGYELGGGGRYDHLLGKFGRSLPSTGFALDMDRLFAALDQSQHQPADGNPPILLVGPPKLYSKTFRLAERLRKLGIHIIQETVQGVPRQYIRYARERGRNLATPTVILLGAPGLSNEVAQLLDCSSKRTRPKVSHVPIQQLPDRMKAQSYGHL